MPNCLEVLLPFRPSAPAACQASLAASPLPTTLELLDPECPALLPGRRPPLPVSRAVFDTRVAHPSSGARGGEGAGGLVCKGAGLGGAGSQAKEVRID